MHCLIYGSGLFVIHVLICPGFWSKSIIHGSSSSDHFMITSRGITAGYSIQKLIILLYCCQLSFVPSLRRSPEQHPTIHLRRQHMAISTKSAANTQRPNLIASLWFRLKTQFLKSQSFSLHHVQAGVDVPFFCRSDSPVFVHSSTPGPVHSRQSYAQS